MKVKVSAPGKVHLIGEHAIVYGHPAIIAAVGRRIYVEAEKNDKVILKDSRWDRKDEWSIQDVKEASKNFKELWQKGADSKNMLELVIWTKDGGKFDNYWKALLGTVLEMVGADSGISVNITKCDIPTGSGLGSSAAGAVAIAKAVSEVYGKKMSLEEVNNIAYECEKLAHGTPSGGDNTACCYGGLVWFQKSQPKNIVKSLAEEIPYKLENFILAYTKQPEKSTAELVQMVRDMPESERDARMAEIGIMVEEMKSVLKNKNYERMKEIINRTNEILSLCGLSIPETESIHKKVVELGGASKMCGACYGGVMLNWHPEPEKVVVAIKELGFAPLEADLAVEGVRLEK